MGRKAAVISIDFNAGVGKMKVDLETGKAALRDFGSSGANSMRQFGGAAVSETKAATAAIKAMEGGFANNTRAATAFLTRIVGMGPILQAAFPVVGLLAFGGMLEKVGSVAVDFFKKIQDAPVKLASAFRDLNVPIQIANDELRLTNDRLANEIAKLEGRPQNGLAVALDEARVNADKLADSLEKDLTKFGNLMKENGLGGLRAFFTGQKSTSGDQAEITEFSKRIAKIDEEGQASVRAAKSKESAQKSQESWNKRALDAIDAEIDKYKVLAGQTQKLQDLHEGKGNAPTWLEYQQHPEKYTGYNTSSTTPDASLLLKERKGTVSNLQSIRDTYGLRADNDALESRKAMDEAAEENRKKQQEKQDKWDALTRYSTTENARRQNDFMLPPSPLKDWEAKEKMSEEMLALQKYTEDSDRKFANLTFLPDRTQEKDWEEGFGADRQVRDIQLGATREGMLRQSSRASQMSAMQQPDQKKAIAEAYQLRIGLAQQLKVFEMARASEEENAGKRRVDEAKAEADYQKETAEARLDMEMKILQVKRQQVEQIKNSIAGPASSEIAKLATGQKTDFGKMFQGMGEGVVKQGVESLAKKGLGKLGEMFGLSSGKRTGSSPADALFVQMVSAAAMAGGSTGGIQMGGEGGTDFNLLSKVLSVAGRFGGFMASGGDVNPGMSYAVGDGGETEIFTPKTAGTITPVSKLGGGPSYHIDARGADLGAGNRVARAIEAAHQSAVANSIHANVERNKRIPQRSGS